MVHAEIFLSSFVVSAHPLIHATTQYVFCKLTLRKQPSFYKSNSYPRPQNKAPVVLPVDRMWHLEQLAVTRCWLTTTGDHKSSTGKVQLDWTCSYNMAFRGGEQGEFFLQCRVFSLRTRPDLNINVTAVDNKPLRRCYGCTAPKEI